MRHAARATRLLLAGAALAAPPAAGAEIPYFARKYGVSCAQCHVAPPKLNAAGEAFVAAGYRLPDLVSPRATWPFAVWASGRSETLPSVDAVRTYINRLELIAGGPLGRGVSYFIEWRPVSLETRADGSLRDRSGRFEDLFVTAAAGRAEVTAGQFRLINQVDVSRRLGLSEPLVLATSLPGAPGGTARDVALRGFSPAGRSPAVRVGYHAPLRGAWRWTTSVAIPFPGELSLPLTRAARREASNELATDPKGVLVESYARRGLFSFGGHAFYDHADRFLAQVLTSGAQGPLHWTAVAGVARRPAVLRGRWSVEAEYVPRSAVGAGVRAEDEAADGRRPALLVYLNAHFPATRYTIRLTLEQRVQRDRSATVLELGAIF